MFNLLLQDLYGPARVLHEGLLPPDLLYYHPTGLTLPCQGMPLPGAKKLRCYAADLARGPDGAFWVVDNFTGALPGIGNTLEHRTVMSQLVPDLFGRFQVHRLAQFFRALRAGIGALSPGGKSDPRVVLLTPGPGFPGHFEHAYLASYLGYTMVQGADLTVREGRLHLRTLAGLEPVDVVLSQVEESLCDPLELRADSGVGVAGLVEAARRGTVAVVNPLGSGVLEHRGLPAFLPGLARHFLGEDLILPSVATWWCGQPRECAYVLEHLHELVLRPVRPEAAPDAVHGARLSDEERAAWRDRIRRDPRAYAAQQSIHLATAPAWNGAALEPRTTRAADLRGLRRRRLHRAARRPGPDRGRP